MAGSYYGVMFPEFWTGRTGRELRRKGGKDAQILGVYLAANRHANMLGLYRVSLDDIQHETGLKPREVVRALLVLDECGFARYDAASEFVWVMSMARFRLGLKAGEALAPGDKRIVGVNRLYHGIDPNPFLGAFYLQMMTTLQLTKARESHGDQVRVGVESPSPAKHPNREGQQSPTEGASRGLASQLSGSGSVTGISDQGSEISDQEKAGRCAPSSVPWLDNDGVNVNVVTRLAHEALDELGDTASYADIADLLKTLGRRHKVAMTPDTVTRAIESALHQRASRRRA